MEGFEVATVRTDAGRLFQILAATIANSRQLILENKQSSSCRFYYVVAPMSLATITVLQSYYILFHMFLLCRPVVSSSTITP